MLNEHIRNCDCVCYHNTLYDAFPHANQVSLAESIEKSVFDGWPQHNSYRHAHGKPDVHGPRFAIALFQPNANR